MNRREFLQLSALAPASVVSLPIREVRRALTISNSIPCHMIVTAHPDERSAEMQRRAWIGRPFESFGEFYVDSSEIRPRPSELAGISGTLTHHHTTIGVAAERREYLVGAFRREYISIVVRIIGDQEATMLSIAEHVASQEIPSHFEVFWSSTLLASFIPTNNTFLLPVEKTSTYWP